MRAIHKKRGTIYGVYASAAMLQTEHLIGDNTPLAIYIGKDGKVWARPIGEFLDGRFDVVDSLPVFHEAAGGVVTDHKHSTILSLNLEELTTSEAQALMGIILDALNAHVGLGNLVPKLHVKDGKIVPVILATGEIKN